MRTDGQKATTTAAGPGLRLKTSKRGPATPKGEYSVDGRTNDVYVTTAWNPGVPYLAFF